MGEKEGAFAENTFCAHARTLWTVVTSGSDDSTPRISSVAARQAVFLSPATSTRSLLPGGERSGIFSSFGICAAELRPGARLQQA